jgi:DNA invertase Pin-like site-specific DNA recombinase
MSTQAWLIVALVAVPLLAAGLALQLGRRRAAAADALGPDPAAGPTRAVGYTIFPDRRQTVSPEGRYQARRIEASCEARGMVLHKLIGDVRSYSGPDLERPALVYALTLLESGEASCLIVTSLDRLSRSPANVGTLVEWIEELGGRLVVIDIDLDTSNEQGQVAARALTRVGALERERIQSGPAPQLRPPAVTRSGGRPAVADRPLLQRRIAMMRASGMTLQAIADTLNREGVPTIRGGTEWRPSSVQAAVGYKRPRRPEQ